MLWLVLIVCSRSTAVDLLSSRRARDGRRQHIQHQLDSLRFYDSVPLYDGLRRFTPGTAAVTASNPAADQDNPRGDSPWPPVPPTHGVQPHCGSRKRLRRVASEPTDGGGGRGGRGRSKQSRGGLWSLAGSGRPSAAPRWPTTAETVGGLRPRHWPPPVNDHTKPYWIRYVRTTAAQQSLQPTGCLAWSSVAEWLECLTQVNFTRTCSGD